MLSTGKKYVNNPTRTSILPLAFSSVLLMLTQIIAGEVNTKLKLLTKLRATNGTDKKWEIPDSGSSAATVLNYETDVKPEAPVSSGRRGGEI